MQLRMKNLSTSYQTSRVGAFHSVVIQFAPKCTVTLWFILQFYKLGCIPTWLYNQNSAKPQAVTKR